MSNLLYGIEESDLAEVYDEVACGDECEHLVHDGELHYWRLTYEQRQEIRQRAETALAASTIHDASRTALWAVAERAQTPEGAP